MEDMILQRGKEKVFLPEEEKEMKNAITAEKEDIFHITAAKEDTDEDHTLEVIQEEDTERGPVQGTTLFIFSRHRKRSRSSSDRKKRSHRKRSESSRSSSSRSERKEDKSPVRRSNSHEKKEETK